MNAPFAGATNQKKHDGKSQQQRDARAEREPQAKLILSQKKCQRAHCDNRRQLKKPAEVWRAPMHIEGFLKGDVECGIVLHLRWSFEQMGERKTLN